MNSLEYKLHLARATCTFGSTENHINVGTDHGVYAFGNEQGDIMPLLNEGDRVAGVHITRFGTCRAFGRSADEAAEKFEEFPLFSKAVSLFGAGVSARAECKPDICTRWQNTKEDYLVDGLPALTENSFLTCRRGGVIKFVKSSGAAEPSPQEIVDNINAVSPKAVAALPVAAAAAASGNDALGVGRQIYENHSQPAEAARDFFGGVWPWEMRNIRGDYVPWAENLALEYAKDRDMLEYNGDTPITWDNEADALRHFAWSARMTRELSAEKAKTVSENHERKIFYKTVSGYVRFVPLENIMDEQNNAVGIEYAGKLKSGDYASTEPYVKLFTEAKKDGKIALTLDDVYKLDSDLDSSKETELEVKDLGVKRGLLFKCDAKKETTEQIDKAEAEVLIDEYEELQEIFRKHNR